MGLDTVELFIGVEEEFGISIPDERLSDCRTVGDISLLVREFAPSMDPRDVTQRVARVVGDQLNIDPAKISAGDRLIEDLRLN